MRRIYVVLFAMLLITATGCYRNQVELPPKAARAVTTMALSISAPETSFVVSGSVQSWKTEQIGFEVEGRLQWVLEPGKNINGRDKDSDGKLLPALAKVDPSRYKVALASAEAALDVAESDKDVINIRITDSIPSDIESAEADVALAKIEFDRNQLLKRQNAVSQSEYETAANRLQTQQARLSSLQSSFKQAEAELKSAVARVRSAQQSVNDAKRDLANTTLYASYSGQISEVQVVPGSVVTAGSPVVTLQKMDPIKVEIEVSAEQSREIQRRRQLPITFTLPDGSTRKQKAMVYLVDPSADTSTHTFTVTLLVINERTRPPLPAHLGEKGVARTQDIWPLDVSKIVGGAAGIRLVEEAAIETVGEESNIWVIQDYKLGDTMPEVVKVKKQPVQRTDLRLPFLGNWVFRQVTFEDDSIDPKSLVAGKLEFPDNERREWDGETLVPDSGEQWMLRPGDLADVYLNEEQSKPGFFVPVEAIYEDLGSTFVFIVDGNVARKTQVKAVLPERLDNGSSIRIEPIGSNEFATETRIVVGGVHYLNDGDAINITNSIAPAGDQQ